jgi:hypothetical protein
MVESMVGAVREAWLAFGSAMSVAQRRSVPKMSKSSVNYRPRIVCGIIRSVDTQTVWGEVLVVRRWWNWKAGAGELTWLCIGPCATCHGNAPLRSYYCN